MSKMTVKAILSVAGICVVMIGLIIEINLYGNYFIPWVWLLFPTGVLIIISAWFYLLLRKPGTQKLNKMIELTKNEAYELGCRIVTALHVQLYGSEVAIHATKGDVLVFDQTDEKHLAFVKNQQERLRDQAMLLAETAIETINSMKAGEYENQFQECKSLLNDPGEVY